MDPDLFISAANDFHLYLAARQVELDDELAVLAHEVKLFNTDGTYYECDPGLAYISRLSAYRKAFNCSMQVSGGSDRFEGNTHRSIALTPYRVRVACQDAGQFCHQLTDHACPKTTLSSLNSTI